MREEDCKNMLIEDLEVSEACLDGLRKVGFTMVDEIVDFFEETWGQGNTVDPHPDFLKSIDETINKLKAMGCWPESLQGE